MEENHYPASLVGPCQTSFQGSKHCSMSYNVPDTVLVPGRKKIMRTLALESSQPGGEGDGRETDVIFLNHTNKRN